MVTNTAVMESKILAVLLVLVIARLHVEFRSISSILYTIFIVLCKRVICAPAQIVDLTKRR